MTAEEATIICNIMKTADNGCPDCAYHLLARFAGAFPEHKDIAKDVFEKEFEITFRG